MCIAIFADQPIVVEFMLESLWPIWRNHGIASFNQGYDLLVRNLGKEPLTRLIVAHPRRLYPDAVAINQDAAILGRSIPHSRPYPQEWVGKRLHHADTPPEIAADKIRFRITDRSSSPAAAVRRAEHTAGVVTCEEVVPYPLILTNHAVRNYALNQEHLPTLLEARLNPHLAPAASGYVILNLFEVPVRAVKEERCRGANLFRQTYEMISPEMVWQVVESHLDADKSGDPGARELYEQIIDKGLRAPGHEAPVRDHRVAVVTHGSGFVDWRANGNIRLLHIRPISEVEKPPPSPHGTVSQERWTKSRDERAHVWLAGASAFPAYDSVHLARQALEQLLHAARETPPHYVTIAGLTLVMGSPSILHSLVALRVLRKMGIVRTEGAGWVLSETHSQSERRLSALENQIRDVAWEIAFRTALTELVRDDRVSFEGGGFRLEVSITSSSG